MPIVTHTIQTAQQADGSTQNTLRMYDQDATEYMVSFPAPPGFDLAARIQLAIADQNERLADQEFQAIIGAE